MRNLLCLYFLYMASHTLVNAYSLADVADNVKLAMYLLKEDTMTEKSRRNINDNGLEDKNKALTNGEIPKTIPCKKFKKPEHGTLRCGGNMCLVQCDPGYIQSEKHAFVYSCKADKKKWKPLPNGKPIPWPDCEKEPSYLSELEDLKR